MSYDPTCLELAEHFLEQPGRMRGPVDGARAKRLAQRIQDTIEDFIQDESDDAREAGR